MGANKPVAPASLLQVGGAGRVVGKKSLELWERLWEPKIATLVNVHEHGRTLPLVAVGDNRIGKLQSTEPPLGLPLRGHHRQPAQRHRLPCREDAYLLNLYVFISWVQGEALVFFGLVPMTDNSKRTGAAIEAHYQFLVWLVPTIEKFPKSHRFTIGDRIETIAIDVLEALIEATYTRERTQHLRQANLGIEKLRFLLRLAADLRVLDRSRYEYTARTLDETGRLIGGWMKAHSALNSEADDGRDAATA